MPGFNAKQARTKRPCPIWMDAFLRDTQHLEADEVGAYFLILGAMWTRESCDLPDDDARLARVARVSITLWKRRIGPVIREFLHAEDGAVFQKRLREEAGFVEHSVAQQSNRRIGKSDVKSLENNERHQSADMAADERRHQPTQQPNNLHTASAVACAGAKPENQPSDQTTRERLLAAIGADPISGMMGPNGATLGRQSDMQTAAGWSDLGLTIDQQCRIIGERMASARAKAPHFVPRSFAYFTGAMQDAVSARSTAGAAPRKPQSTGPFGDPTLDLIARQVGQA